MLAMSYNCYEQQKWIFFFFFFFFFHYLRHRRRYLLLFVSLTSILIRCDHWKWIKPFLNRFTFRKVYLQHVIKYNWVVTQQGLPISQYLRETKDEMGISKNDTLTTLRFIYRGDSHCLILYWERESVTKTHCFCCCFFVTLQIDPIWFEPNFLEYIFEFKKRNMCNLADGDMPLNWCKRNCYSTCGLAEKLIRFTVCVSVFVGYTYKEY